LKRLKLLFDLTIRRAEIVSKQTIFCLMHILDVE